MPPPQRSVQELETTPEPEPELEREQEPPLAAQLKQIMRDTYDAADTGADGAMAEEPRLFGAGRFASQASRSTGDATPHDVAAPAPGDASALDTQLQELMREPRQQFRFGFKIGAVLCDKVILRCAEYDLCILA